jgi:acyl phosphate:glycerol-3-phosphate acyltransferase
VIGAVCIVAAFLLGSLPIGLLVARLFYRTDLRKEGSGNIGAANALRTLGRGAGALVLVLDAAKGFAAALLAQRFGGETLAFVAAFAAIVGHCYSPWLKFKGGKGVATELGALFALSWPSALIFMAVWGLVVKGTRYASVGSLAATITSFLPLWLFLGWQGAIYGVAVALLIAWRHRENLVRLRDGRENRLIGASSSASNPSGLQ